MCMWYTMFPEVNPRETLSSRWNKTHCFPRGQSLSVLLYLPAQKKCLLEAGWHKFVIVKSSSCCFPRESVSFDQQHLTRPIPIGKCIWVGRYNKCSCISMFKWWLSKCKGFYFRRTIYNCWTHTKSIRAWYPGRTVIGLCLTNITCLCLGQLQIPPFSPLGIFWHLQVLF